MADTMILQMFGATHKGLVRQENEDCFAIDSKQGFMVVSDGMGGHKAGEVASRFVVDQLNDILPQWYFKPENDPTRQMVDILKHINTKLRQKSQTNIEYDGMGATVCCAKFFGNMAVIGHAGDSRVYLLRPNTMPKTQYPWHIWPLTVDHNVGVFQDRGLIADLPLAESQRARLMRGMGVQDELNPDAYLVELQPGDVILACSDGLHGVVSEQEILRIVQTTKIENLTISLLDASLKNGAPDNVTLCCAWINGPLKVETQSETRNFLIRLDNGRIFGNLSASRLMTQWLQGEISSTAEICKSQRSWVSLSRRKQLVQTYPEFNLPAIYFLDQSRENTGKYIDKKALVVSFFLGALVAIFLILMVK